MADFIPVTAEEWPTTDDPSRMLNTALQSGALTARKQLLFCAGLRRLAGDLVPIEYRPIIDELETFADRPDLPVVKRGKLFFNHSFEWSQYQIPPTAVAKRHVELVAACDAILDQRLAARGISGREYHEGYPGCGQDEAMFYAVAGHVYAARDSSEQSAGWELTWSDLLRDVLGNPFRSVAFDPAWRTDTVVSLARGMYESREFSAMPILADALQDAGCDNTDTLNHCRNSGAHFRGCWVCDLVLSRS